MRTVAVLLLAVGLLTAPACKRSPSDPGSAAVQGALRDALQVPMPARARLTTNPPVGPTTDDGSRLSYGMRLMTPADTRVQPYVQRYLSLSESNPDAAMAALDEALAQVPDHEDVLSIKAMVRMNQGKEDEAIALLRLILATHDSAQAPTYVSLGGLLGDRGQLEEALDVANAGLQAWPRHKRLMALRGVLLMATGSTTEGLHQLEEAHRLYPGDASTHLYLARGYAEAGHHIFAVQHAEAAVLLTQDPQERRSASGVALSSLSRNVQWTSGGVAATLVPTANARVDPALLQDPQATWDVRMEIATVIAATEFADESPPGNAVELLDRLARTRTLATRLAVAAAPDRPVHPVVALQVEADLLHCGVAYNAVVLGAQGDTFPRWIDAHPREDESLELCLQEGLFEQERVQQIGRRIDLSRASWGIPLDDASK